MSRRRAAWETTPRRVRLAGLNLLRMIVLTAWLAGVAREMIARARRGLEVVEETPEREDDVAPDTVEALPRVNCWAREFRAARVSS